MDYSICPCCDSNDSVQRVATVVDNGTESGMTGGASIVLGNGNIALAPGIYGSINRTRLARRLSPRTIAPGNIEPWVFFLGYLVLSCFSAYVIASIATPQLMAGKDILEAGFIVFLWFFPGMIVASIVFTIIYLICYATMLGQRKKWMIAAEHLRSSYYCFRDDVVFDEVDWASPEDFVPYLFNK